MLKTKRTKIFVALTIAVLLILSAGVAAAAEGQSDQGEAPAEGFGGEIEAYQELSKEEPSENLIIGMEPMGTTEEKRYTYYLGSYYPFTIGEQYVAKVTAATRTLYSDVYVVEGTININGTLTVNGDVIMIITDGSSLTVTAENGAAIHVTEGSRLVVSSSSIGPERGSLTVTGLSTEGQAELRRGCGADAEHPRKTGDSRCGGDR